MMRSFHNGSGEIYQQCLNAICGDVSGKTLIDLCAGRALHSQQVGFKECTLIDCNWFDEREGNKDFIRADVRSSNPAFETHYDVSLLSDGLEHFTVGDAIGVLNRMTAISDLQIVFTPVGPYMCNPETTDPNTHKSYWYPWQFTGWATLEMPVYHPLLHLGAFWAWRYNTVDATRESFIHVYQRLRKLNLIECLPVFALGTFP